LFRLALLNLCHAAAGDEMNLDMSLPSFEPNDPTVRQIIDMYNLHVEPNAAFPTNRVKLMLPRLLTYISWFSKILGWGGIFRYDMVKRGPAALERVVRTKFLLRSKGTVADSIPFLANTCVANSSLDGVIALELKPKIIDKGKSHIAAIKPLLDAAGAVVGILMSLSSSADVFIKVDAVHPLMVGMIQFQLKHEMKCMSLTKLI